GLIKATDEDKSRNSRKFSVQQSGRIIQWKSKKKDSSSSKSSDRD
uniref:Uncharacterized protein n=1 Tax=Anopheles funestus TaxID=62324 RepID=A0A182S3T2_ANOFN